MQFAWRRALQRLVFATRWGWVDQAFAMHLAPSLSASAGHPVTKTRAYPSNPEAGRYVHGFHPGLSIGVLEAALAANADVRSRLKAPTWVPPGQWIIWIHWRCGIIQEWQVAGTVFVNEDVRFFMLRFLNSDLLWRAAYQG